MTPTMRDFILKNEICELYDLYNFASIFDDEGLPLDVFDADPAPFQPQHIFTDKVKDVAIDFVSILTESVLQSNGSLIDITYPKKYTQQISAEDTDQLNPSADSLCALLGNQTIDDNCNICKTKTLFIAALSDDWCLKQLNDGMFYREICANPDAVGRWTAVGYETAQAGYTLQGVSSIFRFAPLFVKNAGVQSKMLELDYLSQPQTPPSQIGLRVGISAQVADPNTDECRIVWHQHSLKDLTCISERTAAQHRALNTKPSETLHWNFVRNGKILYFELRIDGVGGDAVFSRVNSDVERYEINNY
jgi:hypothetical protein